MSQGKSTLKGSDILSGLNGILTNPQRKLLDLQLAHLKDLQDNLQEIEQEIQSDFMKFAGPITLLKSIPGVDSRAAYAILAEIGRDMTAFPTAQHICSWAGLAPGNYQSAGKTKKQCDTQ